MKTEYSNLLKRPQWFGIRKIILAENNKYLIMLFDFVAQLSIKISFYQTN